ncbi:MAG TPA: hypothetical protein VNL70_01590, partial [Tepidisphaeraceae bacterium]|nr:hypothetical protein [Tepidisphaeraceae bacterium]
MSDLATHELWSIFDARRVKPPELTPYDTFFNSFVGWFKNHRPLLGRLREQAERVEKLEPEIHALGASRFREEVDRVRELARLNKLTGPAMDRGVALAREAC